MSHVQSVCTSPEQGLEDEERSVPVPELFRPTAPAEEARKSGLNDADKKRGRRIRASSMLRPDFDPWTIQM